MALSSEDNLEKTWQEELLHLIAGQARIILVPILTGVLIVTYMASDAVDTIYWVGWLVLEVISTTFRRLSFPRIANANTLSVKTRLRLIMLITTINTIVHGLSIYFMIYLNDVERTIHMTMMVMVCIGAVVTTVGYRPLLTAYLLPILIPLTLFWAFSPSLDETGLAARAMVIAILVFALVLFSHAREIFRLFRESFDIRTRQIQLNKQLEAANRAKTRFLASASHDLRQPIHAASLFCATLKKSPDNSAAPEIIDRLDLALQTTTAQLDILLDISMMDAGIVEVVPTEVSLCSLVDRIQNELQSLADKKLIGLSYICHHQSVVTTDTALLDRLLRNLIGNAIKYTNSGQVTVEVDSHHSFSEIRISDTGCGIPDDEKEKVFEEFYQIGNPSRDRTQGLGLGLAIVRRIVDLLGYTLTCESTVGKGTVFTLRLSSLAIESNTEDKRVTSKKQVASIQGTSILLIDDDPEVLRSMELLLDSFGCHVVAVPGIKEAKQAADHFEPAVVVSDLRLSNNEDGVAAIQTIQATYPATAGLLVSGDTAPDRLKMAHEAGIDLLYKPVPAYELIRHISYLLDKKSDKST